MSLSTNQSGPRALLTHLTLPRPRLTVVPRVASRTPRLPFVVLVVAVLAAGLVGLLLLNTSMERGAYQVTALRTQTANLALQQESLQLRVGALQDPETVARKALELGMVANPSPAFLSLSTGRIIGHSVAGVAGGGLDLGLPPIAVVGRLGKIHPVVGGASASASSPLTTYTPPKTPGHQAGTKGGDTSARSPGSAR